MKGSKNTVKTHKECTHCEKNQALTTGYYLADVLLHPDGRFHICRTCIEKIIEKDGFNGFITVLRAMNKPFIQDIWKDDYKDYIRQISSLPQYRGMTFDHSVYQQPKNNRMSGDLEEIESDLIDDGLITITQRMRLFWRGYTDAEILILESYFQDLISSYECETPIQRSIYRNMAITQYMADNAKTATEFDKLMSTLSKLMTDANVKPVQESGANDSGLSTWGEWVKKIEETEPIPEPTEEFKDVDNIKKYIDKWFVRHFAKIFGIADVNEHAEEDALIELSGEKNER